MSIGHRYDTENFKKVYKGEASVFLCGTILIAIYDIPWFAAVMIALMFIGKIAFFKSQIQPVCQRISELEEKLAS